MENRTKPYVFSHKARPGVDVGNMVRGVDFGLVWLPPFIVKLIFNEIIDCAVPLGLVMEVAVCIGMAAFKLLIAALADAVLF